jgi:tetratricopeptide (TPR) repeat protein
LGLLAGCFPSAFFSGRGNDPSPNPMGDPLASAKVTIPQRDLPKRAPKADTCVAFGRLQLEAARDGTRSPAQSRELYDTARKYFQEGMKTDPKCLDAYIGLIRAYEGLGDHVRTVEAYQKAISTFPKEAALYYELGMYQARRKEWGSSLDNLCKATELAPDNRQYANMRGFCLARMGRYDESLAWFTKTVGEPEAHYNVARMLHHVKHEEACKRHLQRSLEINPGYREAREFLAQLQGPAAADPAVDTAAFTTAPAPPSLPKTDFATQKR